jgi:hypothetical protein
VLLSENLEKQNLGLVVEVEVATLQSRLKWLSNAIS